MRAFRASESPEVLTRRESEGLRLLAQGFSNQEIAYSLLLGTKTIKTYISNMLACLEVPCCTQEALSAVCLGLVPSTSLAHERNAQSKKRKRKHLMGANLLPQPNDKEYPFLEELYARQARATFQAEVGVALTRRGTLAEMLQSCAQAMVHHLHAAFARIWLLKPGEDVLQLHASAGMYTHLNGAHSRIPVGELKIGLIAQERQPHLTNDVINDPRVSDKQWARRERMVSFAGYPLLVEDQVVGVMAMFSREVLQENILDALASVAYAVAQGIGRKWAEEQLEERVHERTKELAESNEQVSSILESITDGFMHLDQAWRYRYINEQMKKIIKPKEEVRPGQCIWDVVPELLGTPFERNYREAMEKRQVIHFEGCHPSRQRWLDVHVYPIKDGITVYLHDITDRKQAEEAWRESEARFRKLVDSNIIGIIVYDLDGNVREANDAFLRLVGYTQEDVTAGRIKWTTLTPPEYQAGDVERIEEMLRTGVLQPFEKAFIRKDGTRVPVLIGAVFLRWEGHSHVGIAFVLDQTVHKELERQKDLMLGMTSHELKTPLAALKGTLQLIQRRLKRAVVINYVPPEWQGFFQDLTKSLWDSLRQIDVQTYLINDLLDTSRITAGTLKLELEPSDLVALVRETVEDLRVIAPERSLVLDVPAHAVANVFVDQKRISQVITNYVANALRYSSADQPVQIGLKLQEQRARVWVRDQGPGLSKEAQQKVWQCFHQVKGVPVQSGLGKGLGLGLFICQTLIAEHQGEVGVESTPGEGSTFWFALPLTT